MKKLILLLFVCSFFSCKKDKECDLPTEQVGTGEIINTAYIRKISASTKDSYIIQKDSLNEFEVSFDNQKTFQAVDFSKYTVLGKYAEGSGCGVIFERNVTKNDVQKTINYQITVNQCGTCEKLEMNRNWVLIPKVPTDYQVIFDVK